MSYFPLDRDILTSSLWAQGSAEAFKVWTYLMLSADPHDGVVRDSLPGIALRCGLSVETVEEVMDWLMSPDKHSRTPDLEGRRVSRVDDGFELVNYCRRRDKDYSTPRVKTWRERNAMKRSETVKRRCTVPETTDTDTDTNNDTETEETAVEVPPEAGACLPAAEAAYDPPAEDEPTAGTLLSPRPQRESPKVDHAEETATKTVACFNAVFGRRVSVLPQYVERIRKRTSLKRGAVKHWQFIALPILVDARDPDPDFRKALQLEWLLRDGSHPRTTQGGRTAGGTDWVLREFSAVDQVKLSARLATIAEEFDVLKLLKLMGVTVDGE